MASRRLGNQHTHMRSCTHTHRHRHGSGHSGLVARTDGRHEEGEHVVVMQKPKHGLHPPRCRAREHQRGHQAGGSRVLALPRKLLWAPPPANKRLGESVALTDGKWVGVGSNGAAGAVLALETPHRQSAQYCRRTIITTQPYQPATLAITNADRSTCCSSG